MRRYEIRQKMTYSEYSRVVSRHLVYAFRLKWECQLKAMFFFSFSLLSFIISSSLHER